MLEVVQKSFLTDELKSEFAELLKERFMRFDFY